MYCNYMYYCKHVTMNIHPMMKYNFLVLFQIRFLLEKLFKSHPDWLQGHVVP